MSLSSAISFFFNIFQNSRTMLYTSELTSGKQLSMILVKDVKNMADVRKMVIAGDLKCCIIKPCLIIDPFQIIVAANKAVLSETHGTMVTKSLYTEILYNLSLSKKITQSLIKFGVENTDTDVIVCVIDENEEDIEKILSKFEGEKCLMGALSSLSQESLIKKEYKISGVETCVSSLLLSVVSRIAAKDFVALS